MLHRSPILRNNELETDFPVFVQAILSDFQNGYINELQAQHAIAELIHVVDEGDLEYAIEWMRTGRKIIRSPGYLSELRSIRISGDVVRPALP